MGLTFRLKPRNRAFKKFCRVHFTLNEGHQELAESPWDWKISPKFREVEPKLVKITIRARRSWLLRESKSKVGLYFCPEARKRAFKKFCCIYFTANQRHQELVLRPWDWKISPNFRQIEPKLLEITMSVRRFRLLFQS